MRRGRLGSTALERQEHASHSGSDLARRVTLAYAVAALERREGASDDARAVETARDAGRDPASRLLARSEALARGTTLEESIATILSAARAATLVGVLAATLGGAAAALAALRAPAGEPVSALHLLVGVLGGQTLLLLLWALLALGGAEWLARWSLARVVLGLARALLGLMRFGDRGRGPRGFGERAAAVEAVMRVHATGGVGRATFSAIVHLLWTGFNVGCLAAMLVLFTVRQRDVAWESTLLSAEAWTKVVEVAAIAPRALGVPVPDAAAIAASRFDPAAPQAFAPQSDESRRTWAWFLVGAVATYGLLPRSALAIASLMLRRRALARLRLDVDRPPWSTILLRLDAAARTPSGGAQPSEPERRAIVQPTPAPPSGPPAIVGVELLDTPWPPLEERVARDFGIVASREERAGLLARLAGEPPARLVVVASLRAAPDRGVASLLAPIVAACGERVELVLTGGDRVRSRGDATAVARRVDAWRRAADEAGIAAARVHEIDLERLTAATRGSLASLVDGGQDARPATAPRFERGLALIAEHAARWPIPPTDEDRLALHRDLVRLHEGGPRRWWPSGEMPDAAAIAERVRSAGASWQALLPPSLRLRPRWILAGGAAGAFGCLAAAALLFPPAIAALPAWSGLGALAGAGFGTFGGARGTARPEASADDRFDDAIRAATLAALVDAMQGVGEARIARILERSLPAEDAPIGRDGLAAWLARVGRAADEACRAEGLR